MIKNYLIKKQLLIVTIVLFAQSCFADNGLTKNFNKLNNIEKDKIVYRARAVLEIEAASITKKDVVIAISNSGNTKEIIAILPTIKQLKTPIISITGNPNSILAKAATVNLNSGVEKEACPLGLAPTSSTIATLDGFT